jgi:hypothetical protein
MANGGAGLEGSLYKLFSTIISVVCVWSLPFKNT